MNSVSSRAHAVFELRVTQKYTKDGGAGVGVRSKLCLVDLAGSERVGRQGLVGDRANEGNNINKSLSTLMLCLQYLIRQAAEDDKGSGKKLTVPFRDSKLTMILREALAGALSLFRAYFLTIPPRPVAFSMSRMPSV